MGALNPAATPAPAPAASRATSLLGGSFKTAPTPRATDLPNSTLGPSGPKGAPLPKVTAAARALAMGLPTAAAALALLSRILAMLADVTREGEDYVMPGGGIDDAIADGSCRGDAASGLLAGRLVGDVAVGFLGTELPWVKLYGLSGNDDGAVEPNLDVDVAVAGDVDVDEDEGVTC